MSDDDEKIRMSVLSWLLVIFGVTLFIANYNGVILGALVGMIAGCVAGPLGSFIGLVFIASAQYYIMHRK